MGVGLGLAKGMSMGHGHGQALPTVHRPPPTFFCRVISSAYSTYVACVLWPGRYDYGLAGACRCTNTGNAANSSTLTVSYYSSAEKQRPLAVGLEWEAPRQSGGNIAQLRAWEPSPAQEIREI